MKLTNQKKRSATTVNPIWHEKNRPAKAILRQRALRRITSSKDWCLFLPGISLLDVKLALEQKLITQNTPLILVEKDKFTIRFVKAAATRLGLKRVHFHNGPIETLNLAAIIPSGEKLGFAFLDFCGEFMPQIAIWLNRIPQRILPRKGLPVSYTFRFFRRGLTWREIVRSADNPRRIKKITVMDTGGRKRPTRKLAEDARCIDKLLDICLGSRNPIWPHPVLYRDSVNFMFYFESMIVNGPGFLSHADLLRGLAKRYADATVAQCSTLSCFLSGNSRNRKVSYGPQAQHSSGRCSQGLEDSSHGSR